MNVFRLMPVVLSCLLLAAHFYRGAQLLMVALSLAIPLLLLFRQRWVPSVVTVALLLGAAEWVRTLIAIADMRMQLGLPWERMALILGSVAAITALSALVFRSAALRRRYAGAETSAETSSSG